MQAGREFARDMPHLPAGGGRQTASPWARAAGRPARRAQCCALAVEAAGACETANLRLFWKTAGLRVSRAVGAKPPAASARQRTRRATKAGRRADDWQGALPVYPQSAHPHYTRRLLASSLLWGMEGRARWCKRFGCAPPGPQTTRRPSSIRLASCTAHLIQEPAPRGVLPWAMRLGESRPCMPANNGILPGAIRHDTPEMAVVVCGVWCVVCDVWEVVRGSVGARVMDGRERPHCGPPRNNAMPCPCASLANAKPGNHIANHS
ncbi:hypothetical protein BS50DRAFT_242421 [Corynespora cassiicola Philippines]|uniref:Uncharacterized protein n=1 Tax=Corynespora cassiicola Philippines TaxID=1448308 RepID=A0A2T2P361_CORCC|nr:hypothetical protein BS50DRAFT_242421 [Corynespora cassiicola Philippines]